MSQRVLALERHQAPAYAGYSDPVGGLEIFLGYFRAVVRVDRLGAPTIIHGTMGGVLVVISDPHLPFLPQIPR